MTRVLRSDFITQGPKIAEFERSLAKYCGAKYAVAVSSGTAALHIACLAAGIKEGDEVITSPISFAATANSILYAKARPVFADIKLSNANINVFEIAKNITKKTRAILPVHFGGQPCDMRSISKIAKANKLIVIEDACHALGAEYQNNGTWIKVGSCMHSDMTVFSFHPVKSITTGEGGAILVNDAILYKKLSMLRSHGVTKNNKKFYSLDKNSKGSWYYEMQALGFNYRITDFQCALGISQMKKLDSFINRRRHIAELYNEIFADNPYFDLPSEDAQTRSSWHLYPIRLRKKYLKHKISIFDSFKKRGIMAQVHYLPIYMHPYYRGLGYRGRVCPVAEEFYKSEISIPLHPGIRKSDIDRVFNGIMKVFRNLKNA